MLRQAWHFMALPGDLLRSSPPTSFAGPYGVLRRWPGSMDTECHMTTASTEQAASLGSNDGWERPGIWGMCWESWGLLNSFDGFLLAAMTVWPWHTMTLFGFLSESAMLCCHDRLNVWEMHNHPYWLSWLFGLFWGQTTKLPSIVGFIHYQRTQFIDFYIFSTMGIPAPCCKGLSFGHALCHLQQHSWDTGHATARLSTWEDSLRSVRRWSFDTRPCLKMGYTP